MAFELACTDSVIFLTASADLIFSLSADSDVVERFFSRIRRY